MFQKTKMAKKQNKTKNEETVSIFFQIFDFALKWKIDKIANRLVLRISDLVWRVKMRPEDRMTLK